MLNLLKYDFLFLHSVTIVDYDLFLFIRPYMYNVNVWLQCDERFDLLP